MLEMLAVLIESPLIFAAVVISLVIVMYLMLRVLIYVSRKRHPGNYLSNLVWKIRARRGKGQVQTVEEVYGEVIESLKREGFLGKKDSSGFRSRKKSLEKIPASEKREVLEGIFDLYEAKTYGNRRIKNEAKVVSDLLDRYASI